jgi:hypothetical protein
MLLSCCSRHGTTSSTLMRACVRAPMCNPACANPAPTPSEQSSKPYQCHWQLGIIMSPIWLATVQCLSPTPRKQAQQGKTVVHHIKTLYCLSAGRHTALHLNCTMCHAPHLHRAHLLLPEQARQPHRSKLLLSSLSSRENSAAPCCTCNTVPCCGCTMTARCELISCRPQSRVCHPPSLRLLLRRGL